MDNVHGNFSELHGKFCKTAKIIIQFIFLKNEILQKLITETCKKLFVLHRKSKLHPKFYKNFHAAVMLQCM